MRSVSSTQVAMASVAEQCMGGLVTTCTAQVMPLGSIRDCLEFVGERALLRSSRQGMGNAILTNNAGIAQ